MLDRDKPNNATQRIPVDRHTSKHSPFTAIAIEPLLLKTDEIFSRWVGILVWVIMINSFLIWLPLMKESERR